MDNKRSQNIRIVIADDHPIFRDGLRRLLEAEPGLKVIGEASDGADAVKLAMREFTGLSRDQGESDDREPFLAAETGGVSPSLSRNRRGGFRRQMGFARGWLRDEGRVRQGSGRARRSLRQTGYRHRTAVQ